MKRTRMMVWIILAISLGGLAQSLYFRGRGQSAAQPAVPSAAQSPAEPAKTQPVRKARVVLAAAELRQIDYTVRASGALEAAGRVRIPAGVTGVADTVSFREGDAVGPDTVLCEVDLARYRLLAERAEAEHARAQAKAELATTLYQSRLRLYEEGRDQDKAWVSEEQIATWRADMIGAQAEAARAQADAALAQRDLARAGVRPPLAGIIEEKFVSKGEYVSPDRVIATMLDTSQLRVRFSVTAEEAALLSLGQDVTFSVPAAPAESFHASIFHLGQEADPSTRSVTVLAEVVERLVALRPGTYAAVRIVIRTRPLVVVPERALLPTERGFVVFVAKDNRVAARQVRPGLRADGGVEVLDGLAVGEIVVADGASGLRDGAEIEPVAGAGR